MARKRHYPHGTTGHSIRGNSDAFQEVYIQGGGAGSPIQYNQGFKEEKQIYDHEKLLLEQDAHLLEE